MNVRKLSLTVAGLGLLCLLAWFLQRPAPPVSADPRIGEPLLAAALAESAAEVRLTDQGRTVTLKRDAAGTWSVTSYHDFPADFAKLTGLIAALTDAKLQRLVTARPDRLSRLGFNDSSVTLLDAAGRELWQVAIGKTADGGGRFVRLGSEQKGFLAPLNLWLDAEAKNWADATLLDLKPEAVSKVVVGFAESAAPAITISRDKADAAWTAAAPEGKQLKVERVTSLLSSLGNLRFTETFAPDDPQVATALAHSRTVTLTTFAGRTYTITLGRKPEEKKPKAAAPAEGAKTDQADPGSAADKPKEPEFETIPAGPVIVKISDSEPTSPLNARMAKRAFQISEWTFTGLPAEADLWEAKPAPAPAAAPAPEAPPSQSVP
ncbi:MAG: DUF4340 domain-containing protein [Opitutaceae bacterium]|nr:DUF4340 domain-containing protein [Opitutaceae bacterium]